MVHFLIATLVQFLLAIYSIESDHARLKQKLKPMRGFKTLEGAEKTIADMESMLMLKKRQFTQMKYYQSEADFVHSLFQLTA